MSVKRTILSCAVVVMISFMTIQDTSAQWIETLPSRIRNSIIWSASNEDGTLDAWEFYDFEYPGGGIFNTGSNSDSIVETSFDVPAHSGLFSVKTTINNAFRAQNGSKAVRLMRWTDRAWDDGGDYIPVEAYYSTWMYFPETYNPNKSEPWDPGDGGWWNVFQFKANDDRGNSQPLWTVNVDYDPTRGQMSFYLYSKYNTPASVAQTVPRPIPVGRWVHVEAFYRVSALDEGRITIYQDGKRILDANNVKTALSIFDEHAIWGIGNYTDHIDGGQVPGSATLYFDDSIISTKRVSTIFLRALRR